MSSDYVLQDYTLPGVGSFLAADGRKISIWQWPPAQGRPVLHWAHATGFHARTYLPLLNELYESLNVVAWDMRGHGASRNAAEPSSFQGWQTYYDDLTEFLRLQEEPIWLAGHSIGATTSLAAATRHPEKVAGLILVEPVLLSYAVGAFVLGARAIGQIYRLGHVASAAKRRGCFPSRQAAFENYRAKHSFQSWPDEWLANYVEYGLVDSSENGVCLACSPAWESLSFARSDHNPWRNLARLEGSMPVHVLVAPRHSTVSSSSRRILKRRLPDAVLHEIPNTTHFLPMEANAAVRDYILQNVVR
jgi:pimeloyl-ACP methyl ester carboxylesterase